MKQILFRALALMAGAVLSFHVADAAPTIKPQDKERAAKLVSQMTVDEKIGLISGKVDDFSTLAIPRLGIPSIRMADGPQGVRNVGKKRIHSTFFPCGVSAAASWNRAAVYEMGAGIACAAKAHGTQIMLGPGVNIYRSALCGRNFEYYGEDPYLASETAVSFIKGMQDEGVMATIKHFALNQQEYDRYGVSSNADERTINEIYFPAFRKAVEEAHVGAVMTSYNPVNSVHASENPWLVRENLRAWGHEGIVMTDWSSSYSALGFVKGGVDFEMPRPEAGTPEKLKPLLENGVITEADLDEKCINILAAFSAFGFLDQDLSADLAAEDPVITQRRAYQLALEGPVLLKNEDNILPIKPGKKPIVLIGPNANELVCGGGSGYVNPEDGKGVTLYEGLQRLGKGYKIQFIGSPQPEALKNAGVVIMAVGFGQSTESEGRDRKYGLGRDQEELLRAVTSYTSNVVVVVNSGGEIDINAWAGKVKAILMNWYPGQEGGNALADILSGKVSPSGKLPFTFWGSLDANPAQKWYGKQTMHGKRDPYHFTEYAEGVFLGYRGVEHFGVQPLYPFGYGLSYTRFDYSDASVSPASDGGFDIRFSVRNSGGMAAQEVAQVYVAPQSPSVMRPAKELKGYDKKMIAKGAAVEYSIHLGPEAFSYYDSASHAWKQDPGDYRILIGSSSEDIRLELPLAVK